MTMFSSKLQRLLLHLVLMLLKYPVKWECAVVFLLFTYLGPALQGKRPFLVTLIYASLVMSAPY